MKKRILFALSACLLLVFAAACTKPEQPSEPT